MQQFAVRLLFSRFSKSLLNSLASRTDKFKTVYLAPDRTVEERAQHKELVVELKRRTEAEKDKKLFIRGGKICSIERHKQS